MPDGPRGRTLLILPICFPRFILFQTKKKRKKNLHSLHFRSFSTSVVLQKRSNQTIKYQTKMKNPIRSLLLGIALVGVALAGVAQAATNSYTDNQTIDTSGVSFTFTKFDSSLGSLSAVDLIINSSVPGGSFSFSKTGVGSSTYQSFNGGMQVYSDNSLLFNNSTAISLTATPVAGNGTFQSSSNINNRTFSVAGSQSLLSSVPYTQSIASSGWGDFTGTGSLNLYGLFNALATASGSNLTPQYANLIAPTSLTVRYTYTPASPSPVPEPGQVAASLLLLGGIGGYVFIKRRRKPAVAAA